MQARVNELAEQYARSRAAAMRTQQRMASVSATATSANGLITAVVGATGEPRQLMFNSRKYRDLAPAELAHTIIETIAQARQAALKEIAATLPTQLLGATRVEDLLNGTIDISTLLPESLLPESLLPEPPLAERTPPAGDGPPSGSRPQSATGRG